MTDPEIEYFTHAQLAVSPHNVRFNEVAIKEVEVLSASIVEKGLEQNLLVHPAEPGADWTNGATHGVYAGGRRYRAIGLAIERGQLPSDFQIGAIAKELSIGLIKCDSLGENIQRRDLLPVEVHKAIADAHAEGLTVKQIAQRIDQNEDWVRRQLRLGELHPDIFAAYIADTISDEQAQAYAATEDHPLQLAAFNRFGNVSHFDATPAMIRGFMKVGDRELSRLLLFVGEAVYRGKGGKFELDLFHGNPGQRGRVVDETLLRTLAEEKFALLRDKIRQQTGQSDLQFRVEPPKFADRTDHALEVDPVANTPKGNKGKGRIYRLPAGEIIATIALNDDGEWAPQFWWASRSAKGKAEKAAARNGKSPARTADPVPHSTRALEEPDSDFGRNTRRIIRDEHGLTGDGLQVMRSLRRMILRGAMIFASEKPESDEAMIARDYLTWSGLRNEMTRDRSPAIGARGFREREYRVSHEAEPAEIVRTPLADNVAQQMWEEADAFIGGQTFITEPNLPAAFDAFLQSPASIKRRAEAVLAGLILNRSVNAPGMQVPVHDLIAARLGADKPARIRLLWAPVRSFTGKFSKMARLALAQPFVEPASFKTWHSQKDKVITAAVSAALNGDQGGSRANAAKLWVHPLLAFETPNIAADTEEQPDNSPERELEPAE